MIKKDVMSLILVDMIDIVSSEQLSYLKNVLFVRMSEIEISSYEVSTEVYDNEKFLKMFRDSLLIENKSIKTVEQYIRQTILFLDFFGKSFTEISYEDCMFYLGKLITERHLSSTTVDNTRKFIKPFFTWCFDNEYIPKNPFTKIKRIKRDVIQKNVLSEDDVVLLRDKCDDIRNLAILDVLLSTGVRVSELCRMKISDINFTTGEVSVYGKKTRTYRSVYLNSNAKLHLSNYLQTRTDSLNYLFVTKNSNSGLKESGIQCIMKKLGTLLHKKITVHTFRKH